MKKVFIIETVSTKTGRPVAIFERQTFEAAKYIFNSQCFDYGIKHDKELTETTGTYIIAGPTLQHIGPFYVSFRATH